MCLEYSESNINFNIDVDINPPSIPVRNNKEYDGCNAKKRKWLFENRELIVDWQEEWSKSRDLSAATGGTRSIRFRKVNRQGLVIPEQVNNFWLSLLSRIPSFATKSIFQTGNPPIISEIVLRVWNYL